MFSIIIVTYNCVEYLELTINSIIKNPCHNIEIIVIDGASTDGTLEIIKKYKNNLKHWITEPDSGIYDAMNKGWNLANINNHILFLGAGDLIIDFPFNLKLNNNCVYYGDAVLGNGYIYRGKVDFRLKIGNTLHHQSLLVPKRLHPSAPFNKKYKVFADFDFNQRLFKEKVCFIKLNELKSFYLLNGFSQTYKTKEWLLIIYKNFGVFFAILGYIYHQVNILRKKA